MLEGAKGFTIIEVTIFLAVSGLLLLAMFIGTGSMAARQRFTDSTDSLQVFFQTQYDEVVNGVNTRSESNECKGVSKKPGKSDCLLVGKLLTIRNNDSTIQASYIVSTNDVSGVGNDPMVQLQAAGLQVVTAGETNYEIKWGAVPYNMTRSVGTSVDARAGVNSIAFIRLPNSGRIVQLYYRNEDQSSSDLTHYLNGGNSGSEGVNNSGAYSPDPDSTKSSLSVCIKNDSDFSAGSRVRSAILFGGGQGAGVITTTYDPGSLGLCS